jgi:hypothetical protein
MKLRVKAWYTKELELDGEIARSTMPVLAPDGHGGFYMLSANPRRSGLPIENVLNGHQDRIVAVMELCSEATDLLGNWTSMEGSVTSQLFESIFKRLTDAVQARDTSF